MLSASELTAQFTQLRRQLVSENQSTPDARKALSESTDTWLRELATAVLPEAGFSLVAVGGLGRSEVCAGSDLDLLLLHANEINPAQVAEVADRLWYPIWDSGLKLDHSVRSPAQARNVAAQDFKALLGLLDARVVWGTEEEFSKLRSGVLGDWRAQANRRLPALQELVQERRSRSGELAHLLEPDLKEAYGGIRELSVLNAIAASWLTDVPRGELVGAAQILFTVRDTLHRVTGRPSDRLAMQEQAEVAGVLGYESDDELLRIVYQASRKIAAVSDHTWLRVSRQLSSRKVVKLFTRSEAKTPIADGVLAFGGEAILAAAAEPSRDPGLALRAAAAAAQSGLVFSPATLEVLSRESRAVPIPWPSEIRNSLVSLLGAGAPLINVWEGLDQAGIIERMIPHWAAIRSLPQRNALHIYTVDRHSIECVVQANRYTREVSRPDLLLIAALFHDIGKGQPNHCERGAELMKSIAPTLGFGPADTERLVILLREHLLFAELATGRDLEDSSTIDQLVEAVRDAETLDLLFALTLADSAAAAPGVLTAWKERLFRDLHALARARFSGQETVAHASLPTQVSAADLRQSREVEVAQDADSLVIRIQTHDRLGLLSSIAGALALLGLEVQSASADTQQEVALQEWRVHPLFGQPPDVIVVRQELERVLTGGEDLAKRLAGLQPPRKVKGFIPAPAKVRFVDGASNLASVLEVRAHDAPALLYRVTDALARSGCSVTSAKVSTLGSEVVDVLYLRGSDGGPLSAQEQELVLLQVESILA